VKGHPNVHGTVVRKNVTVTHLTSLQNKITSFHSTSLHFTLRHFTYVRSISTWIPLLVTTFSTLFLNMFSLQWKDSSKPAGNYNQWKNTMSFTRLSFPTYLYAIISAGILNYADKYKSDMIMNICAWNVIYIMYNVNGGLFCIHNIFTGQERALNRIRELDYAVKWVIVCGSQARNLDVTTTIIQGWAGSCCGAYCKEHWARRTRCRLGSLCLI
jgi:hypothetical protein